MTTEILASFAGKISEIASGVVEAGNPLFEAETMKCFVRENAPVSGVFQAVVVVGAAAVAGEVIGYFIEYEE